MKKALMLTVIAFLAVVGAEAQVIVKVRPVTPVVVRSACPSPQHSWVGGPGNGTGRPEIMCGQMGIGQDRAGMVLFGWTVIGVLHVVDGNTFQGIGNNFLLYK